MSSIVQKKTPKILSYYAEQTNICFICKHIKAHLIVIENGLLLEAKTVHETFLKTHLWSRRMLDWTQRDRIKNSQQTHPGLFKLLPTCPPYDKNIISYTSFTVSGI